MGCCSSGQEYEIAGQAPKRSRGCTDVICLLLFIIFLAGMGFIMALTILDGGLVRLINGFDSYGNVCNQQNSKKLNSTDYNGIDTSDRKYVLFFDFLNPKESIKACVSKCPDKTLSTESEFRAFTTTNSLCLYNVSAGDYNKKLCPTLPVHKTFELFNRCIPDLQSLVPKNNTTVNILMKYFNDEWISTIVLQLYSEATVMGYLCLIALTISFVLVFLLRYIAKIMIYVILIVSVIALIGLTSALWVKYDQLLKLNETQMTNLPLFNTDVEIHKAYLGYSIAATVFTVIFVLVIIIMRKRIGLVVQLFAQAQKALGDMPFLLFLPLLTFIFAFAFWIYWFFGALLMASFGKYEQVEKEYKVLEYNYEPWRTPMWIYLCIGLIWVSEFIFACQAMVVSGAVQIWYFSRDKRRIGCPIFRSFSRLFVFHLGSAAFGALVITIIKFPRYVLMYLQKKFNASQNSCVKYMMKCCICCLWFLEKFMKFVNFNAYTIINIEGTPFFTSSKKAFVLIVQNSVRIATINSVGDFLLFIAKIAVTAITLIISLFMLRVPYEDIQQIRPSQTVALLIVGIVSYLIAHCFFTVYEMVIDALMVCFCKDCEENDGSASRPYYMSQSLRQFIDESEKTHIIHEKY